MFVCSKVTISVRHVGSEIFKPNNELHERAERLERRLILRLFNYAFSTEFIASNTVSQCSNGRNINLAVAYFKHSKFPNYLSEHKQQIN